VGGAEAVDGDGLEGAQLHTAVAAVAGAVQDRADGEVVGGVAPGAQRARTGWGASAAHSAIAAIDRAPASTAAAAMARMATSGWRRPRVARGSGTAAR
jgi:hypothetical protein